MVDIRKDLNVFGQSVNVGQIAELGAAGPESQTVIIDDGSTETVEPGMPLKLVPGTSSVPMVDLADPESDPIYGLALYNPKIASWVKTDLLQVSTLGSVIFLKSGGKLSRGDQVGLNDTTFKLQAATLANYIGDLLDDAVTDQIVRVQLAIPLGVSRASA
jgi:hypothetical protein